MNDHSQKTNRITSFLKLSLPTVVILLATASSVVGQGGQAYHRPTTNRYAQVHGTQIGYQGYQYREEQSSAAAMSEMHPNQMMERNAGIIEGCASMEVGDGIGEMEEMMEADEDEKRERIETDRHDFTQSTEVVPLGTRQIEFGYTYFQTSEEGVGDEDSHAGPEMLIRYGLRPNLEFRIRYNEVWQFGDEDRAGSEDLRLGLKTRLTDQCCLRPESALELRMSVPTGSDDWSTGDVEYGLDGIYGWRLNRRTELYGSTGFSTNALGEFGFAVDNPEENNFGLFTQSFAIGIELTERITVFNEVFGLFTQGFEDDEENPAFYNIGVDYYLSDNVVLDVRSGTGLNDDAEDFFFGIGGGFRF